MAKTKISEFSATPGNNTDIDGINIAEGCAPSGINDAIRELMSQLKDFQTGAAGDSFNGPVGTTTAAAGAFTTLSASSTVSGTGFSTYLASPPAIGGTAAAAGSFTTLSASSTVTLSGGTANGVLYLNASKVATSGSALTFNGTNLGVGTASPTNPIHVVNSGSAFIKVQDSSGFGGNSFFGYYDGVGAYIESSSANLVFAVVGSEAMRLTSIGLGIGTSSPGAKVEANVASTASNQFRVYSNDGTAQLRTYSTSDGNGLILNQYYAVAGNPYLRSADFVASMGDVSSTMMRWFTKAYGANPTEQMRLDSSGNLGLGVTPSAWNSTYKTFNFGEGGFLSSRVNASIKNIDLGVNWYRDAGGSYLYAANGYATNYVQQDGVHSWYYAASGTGGNAVTFTQAMRLDASGNLGVGSTNPSNKLVVSDGGAQGIEFNPANTSTLNEILSYNRSGAAYNTLQYRALDHRFLCDTTERARITSGGYFKASDTGTYDSATGAYHEFYQTADQTALYIRATNATLTTGALLGLAASRNTTNNSFYAFSYYNIGAAAYKFRVADSGDVTNTNGTYGTISDRKMKTDIVDAGSQWADIKALRFRKFKMINDPSGLLQLGVVAQEVEETSPGLVEEHTDRDAEGNDLGTTTKSVKTSILLMKAAVALQEAMARIEKLEAEVASLKGA